MYQKLIGTSSPGLFVILVDQSGSMVERYDNSTRAEFAALAGPGGAPSDLFDDTAFTRPVPVAAPRVAATPARPVETFQSKVERMAPAPA